MFSSNKGVIESAFRKIGLAFLKIGLAFQKIGLAFRKIGLAFLKIGLAFAWLFLAYFGGVYIFSLPSLPYHQIDGVVKYSILISAVLIHHTTQSSFYLDTPFAILGTETITFCWTTKSFLVNNP